MERVLPCGCHFKINFSLIVSLISSTAATNDNQPEQPDQALQTDQPQQQDEAQQPEKTDPPLQIHETVFNGILTWQCAPFPNTCNPTIFA